MARRKLLNPTKAVTIRIDQALAINFELQQQDPLAGRSAYGKKSLIVEQLLTRLIEAARLDATTVAVGDLTDIILQR